MEKWRDVQGYDGKYRVSNMGNIRGVKNHNLVFFRNSTGYNMICLFGKNGRKAYYIHRLVAAHFVDNPLNKKEVNHKNGDKLDNRASNLEWVTRSENQKHAFNVLHPGCHKIPRNRKKASDV